jgi:hypothetical protein
MKGRFGYFSPRYRKRRVYTAPCRPAEPGKASIPVCPQAGRDPALCGGTLPIVLCRDLEEKQEA